MKCQIPEVGVGAFLLLILSLQITDMACRYDDIVIPQLAKNTDSLIRRVYLKYNLNVLQILN
jgi:hypothetical protein